MKFEAKIKTGKNALRETRIEVLDKAGKFLVQAGELNEIVDAEIIGPGILSLIIEGKSYLVHITEGKNQKSVFLAGREYIFNEGEDAPELIQAGPGKFEGKIKAPMPGSVVKINGKEGDIIAAGQVLIIVEAMKMENEMRAPVEVRIDKIMVREKEQVEGMQVLMEVSEVEKK
ncbi:biotin/lipoyl-binding protein [bacterium]|nr:biotin/lipoyl-binding protein [bacterium]